MPYFGPGDLDHTRPSKGPKHVFHVNLAQIRSVVPEIFHTQTKKVTDSTKKEPYAVHCVW